MNDRDPAPGRAAPPPTPARPPLRAFYPDCHFRRDDPPYRDASEWPALVASGDGLVDVDGEVLGACVPAAEWPEWTDRVGFGIATGLPLLDRIGGEP